MINTCTICDKDIESLRSTKIYCSSACKQISYRNKKEAYRNKSPKSKQETDAFQEIADKFGDL